MGAKIKCPNKALGKIQIVPAFREETVKSTLSLFKVLAIGNQDDAASRLKPASEVIARLRAEHNTRLIRRATQ